MLVIGAKGFAKEVLQILHQKNELENLAFYDDVTLDIGTHLYSKFPILKNKKEAEHYFSTIDNRFTIGIGNPQLRRNLYNDFISMGGIFTSTVSLKTDIGCYGIMIGEGCNILSGAILSNDVFIGKGVIIYYNCLLTHEVIIGDFVEISPNVTLLGNVEIGSYTQIGANTTVLPKVKIGQNVIIGAGSVVTKDIPDNTVAFGVPAKIIKKI
jgi:sugar O-acyltransferase (sialic acid O-acetyltransferase NeuD family)